MESKLVEKVVEKRNSSMYYKIVENKIELNRELLNKQSSLNPHLPNYSIMPHDHISPQHFLKNPKEIHDNKLKYLAYFDIIIDQHIRHVRPNQPHDNQFKFTKKQYIPDIIEENDIGSNLFIEYKFNLESEYHVRCEQEITRELNLDNYDHHEDHVLF
jgi:hypothetical protein